MSQEWPPKDTNWIKKFRFFTPIQVRFSDTDMLGHINNVSYFSYFEHGRLAYFQELDLVPHLLNPETGHSGFVVTASLECQYLRQVHFGKEVNLGVRVSRLGNSSFDFEYALVLPEDRVLAAVGRGTVVYIDPHTGKGTPLPKKAKQIIAAYETSLV